MPGHLDPLLDRHQPLRSPLMPWRSFLRGRPVTAAALLLALVFGPPAPSSPPARVEAAVAPPASSPPAPFPSFGTFGVGGRPRVLLDKLGLKASAHPLPKAWREATGLPLEAVEACAFIALDEGKRGALVVRA